MSETVKTLIIRKWSHRLTLAGCSQHSTLACILPRSAAAGAMADYLIALPHGREPRAARVRAARIMRRKNDSNHFEGETARPH